MEETDKNPAKIVGYWEAGSISISSAAYGCGKGFGFGCGNGLDVRFYSHVGLLG